MCARLWMHRSAAFAFVGVVVIAAFLPLNSHELSAPGLDAIGRDTTCAGVYADGDYPVIDTYCHSQILNTTRANDVIILMVRDQASAIIDSSGLSFKLRVSASFSEYYAIAKTPLRMDNVSVIFQGHCCPISQVFAIQGANTAIIFDPRPEFPLFVSKCGVHYGYACSATIETATHDFIIAGVLLADSGLNIGERPQAFTRIEATGLFEVDYHLTGHVEHDINFTIPIIGRNNVITAAYSIMLDAVSLKQ